MGIVTGISLKMKLEKKSLMDNKENKSVLNILFQLDFYIWRLICLSKSHLSWLMNVSLLSLTSWYGLISVTFLIRYDMHITCYTRCNSRHLTYIILFIIKNLKNKNYLYFIDEDWHLYHLITILLYLSQSVTSSLLRFLCLSTCLFLCLENLPPEFLNLPSPVRT